MTLIGYSMMCEQGARSSWYETSPWPKKPASDLTAMSDRSPCRRNRRE